MCWLELAKTLLMPGNLVPSSPRDFKGANKVYLRRLALYYSASSIALIKLDAGSRSAYSEDKCSAYNWSLFDFTIVV